MLKLIAYNINPVNILTDSSHRKIVTELIRNNKEIIILAPDAVESTPTVAFIPSFTVSPSSEATLLSMLANKVRGLNKYLIVATNVGSPMGLDEMINNDPNYQIIPLSESSLKKSDSVKELVTFAVGRTNGPTDHIVKEVLQDGYKIRYDVNSRIEIVNGAGTTKMTFTFKPRKESNMAKIALLDGREVILMQKDFNLWILGLNVLLNNWDAVVKQIKLLF